MNRIAAAFGVLGIGLITCARILSSAIDDPRSDLSFDDRERSYFLHAPPTHDDSASLPLVLAFHGGGGNAKNQIRISGLNKLADEMGFIVVYPNGTGKLFDKVLTWNGGGCCGYAQEKGVDDVGYVRALISEVRSTYTIDPKHIYATGFSNGAIFSYRLACEASDLFAAVAPVAGTVMVPDCHPVHPVSIVHFHGTEDTHLPFNGGVGDDSLTHTNFTSVPESIALWIQNNHCPVRADQSQLLDIIHLSYSACSQNTAVELYEIAGGGHAWPGSDSQAWPGGDEPTQTISATQLLWDFFAAHPKP